MIDILKKITPKDRLDFAQTLSIARNYLGDRIFPDVKTANLKAEYYRLAAGANMPVMATVHAFDTEAEIGSRQSFDKVEVEKLLIKRKINQTEKVLLLMENGVSEEDALVQYIFDDMRNMAEGVKTRSEVAKMEVLSSGKMTINENNLTQEIGYGVSAENLTFTVDLTLPDKDVIGAIKKVVDAAADAGYRITEMVTSGTVLNLLTQNKGIQTLLFGSAGIGAYAPIERIKSLFGSLFQFTEITVNNERYKLQKAAGTYEKKRYFPENKISFIGTAVGGEFGTGLWGDPPEAAEYGQFSQKSNDQFITLSQWATPDPVAVWTKASGLFIPVLPNPDGLFVATATLPQNP